MSELHDKFKQNKDEIDLVELFNLLKSHKKIILLVTLLFGLLGTMYALFATPVYKADALIQIEKNKNNR